MFNYVLDAKVETVVRQAYSIFDAIASTGGLMGVIF
jgi:methylmalonyl-CoA mutase N-terminal domain/subunit